MKTRTLLLLGGSQQQIVAIEKAKECGYRTVLCDYLPDNPGQYHADAFYQVSTTDRDAVLNIAHKECVDGIIAYSSDPAAPTAAYVAEIMGLPTNPLTAVETLSEKHLFRKHLGKAGLPCPSSFPFQADVNLDDLWHKIATLRMPVVVKPTDSSGSKGVTVLSSRTELLHAVAHASSFSRNGVLICEEYIERVFPSVVGGDIFVVDGKICFWGLMRCLRDPMQDLVPVGEMIPSGLTELQTEKTKNALQVLVTSLGIVSGELNVEVLIGEDDTPFVLELGGRAGGNMIPVQLSDASGIDLIRANVMCAMGDDPGDITWGPFSCCDTSGSFATYVLHSLEDGVFQGVFLSQEAQLACYRTVLYQKEGSRVERFDGANKALGILFFRFENELMAKEFFSKINVHVHIRVDEAI